MLLADAAVSPTISDSLPVLREVFVQEDDDSEPWEPIDDTAEAGCRLVHHQLYVQQYQTSPGAPDGAKGVPEVRGFIYPMIVTSLGQDPAQRLPHVRAPIRYHDSV